MGAEFKLIFWKRQVFHSAVVQETKRRAQNVFVDEEELESRNFAKAVEGEALDLDKELEKAILERAKEAGMCFIMLLSNEYFAHSLFPKQM